MKKEILITFVSFSLFIFLLFKINRLKKIINRIVEYIDFETNDIENKINELEISINKINCENNYNKRYFIDNFNIIKDILNNLKLSEDNTLSELRNSINNLNLEDNYVIEQLNQILNNFRINIVNQELLQDKSINKLNNLLLIVNDSLNNKLNTIETLNSANLLLESHNNCEITLLKDIGQIGNQNTPSICKTNRVLVSDDNNNYHSNFYMPDPSLYDDFTLFFVDVKSSLPLTIETTKTNLVDQLLVTHNNYVSFYSYNSQWYYINTNSL